MSLETRQMSVHAAEEMSAVATGQMSAAETGQISAVAMLMSQKSQLSQCHNVQVTDKRSGPKSTKIARNGSRMSPGLENTPK